LRGILGPRMSQENVEIVRASREAWTRGDMAALFEFYDPEIEWDMSHSFMPDMGVFCGHDGIRKLFGELLTFLDGYWARPEEFIDAGDEGIVRIRQGGRGHSSAVDVEMPMFWQVYRLRGDRAVRVEVYREEAEALAAVGLADKDGAA
jgi:ketosteroid isomerase-like protein